MKRAFPPSQRRDSDASELHKITAKCLRTRVGNGCTHTLAHTNTRSNPPTRTDSFTFLSLDPIRNALHQHVADFLQWYVSIHISNLAPTTLRFSSSRSTLSNILEPQFLLHTESQCSGLLRAFVCASV